MPRPEALHQVQSMNSLNKVTEANALVKALILAAEVLEVEGRGLLLVSRAQKIVREASAGESRCDLRLVTCRSADGGDIGTCQSVAMW